MGGGWRDRLRLRGWITAAATGGSFAFGAALPVGVFSESTDRIATVFLGLFAASILPSVSILLQSLTSSTRSVMRVNELYKELSAAIDSLFRILGVSGLATFALFTNSISTPIYLGALSDFDVLQRFGNGILLSSIAFLIAESGKIPAIIRRSLAARFEVAKEEAKDRTKDQAPTDFEVKSHFRTREGFGKVTVLKQAEPIEEG